MSELLEAALLALISVLVLGKMENGNSAIATDDSAALTAYEYLRLFSPAVDAETEIDILRHLETVDVTESQRPSVNELHRIHFAQLLRARREHRRNSIERISMRRSQIRARGREKWRGVSPDDGLSVEQVQEQFPEIFRLQPKKQPPTTGKSLGGRPQPQAPTAPNPVVIVDPAPHQNVNKPTSRTVMGTPAGRQDPSPASSAVPAIPQRQSVQPPTPSISGPQRTLSELLRKKANENEDGDEIMTYPSRPPQKEIRSVPNGRNPFQTAGDKLQRDRASGKDNMEEYDDGGANRFNRNNRDLARHGRSGSYHPVNPQLLFGGSNGMDDGGEDHLDASGAIRKRFVSPVVRSGEDRHTPKPSAQHTKPNGAGPEDEENIDPRLKSCDPELIAKIEMEIVDNGDPITFDDIAGLQFAKKCVNELVIWPMARPDIFTGLRALPKGLLLFGPPGTGKTLIGKAIASQSGATFFSISASSLTSKWIGEGEKLVRTLFAVAAVKQPSVIFIDEIDSLLTQRSSEENEASRRMKTEFLVQLDGAGTKAKDVILVVGATNRPQELDEAARRRFVKRLYIPLPSYEARMDLMNRLLKDNRHELSEEDLKFVAEKTAGYSGADVRALCTEAAMGPIRSCTDIQTMDANSVRPISVDDFNDALRGVRSSVAAKDLDFYKAWNDEFGSFAFVGHED